VRETTGQIDDLILEINKRVEKGEKVLVTTLTKKMSEELTAYFESKDIRVRYMHSDIEALDRLEIIRDLRLGKFDVLVGINLLREGLDIPEVSLVAIMDADKEGFLRCETSLIQTIGRSARNANGRVIMYADKITESMQLTIDETNRRRAVQLKYNEDNGITPQAIIKARNRIIGLDKDTDFEPVPQGQKPIALMYEKEYTHEVDIAADPVVSYMNSESLQHTITQLRTQMVEAAKNMEFIEAARLRDEIIKLENRLQALENES
jgi:excinuclease ABC subunit B